MHRICLLLLALFPVFSWADSHRTNDWPEGSAMHTGYLAKDRLEEADEELNQVYRQLLQKLPNDKDDNYPRRTLINAQKAWVKYRNASCAFKGEVEGGVRMWKSTYTVSCEAEETKRRTVELKKFLESR